MVRKLLFVLALFCCAAVPFAARAGQTESTVLVIPARYTIVQMGFDIAHLRPVSLVAYPATLPTHAPPTLHVWNREAQDWIPTSVAEYGEGSIFLTRPSTALVLGPDADLPAGLADASERLAARAERIPALDVVEWVNTLDRHLNFTAQEWRWLADRHGLQIKDLNDERRRYGKYGPSR